jgi:hypothetical protein
MAHILIDKSNLCTCNCASTCILGKTGSAPRCTEKQIKEAGHRTVKLKKRKWFFSYFIKDKEKLNNIKTNLDVSDINTQLSTSKLSIFLSLDSLIGHSKYLVK